MTSTLWTSQLLTFTFSYMHTLLIASREKKKNLVRYVWLNSWPLNCRPLHFVLYIPCWLCGGKNISFTHVCVNDVMCTNESAWCTFEWVPSHVRYGVATISRLPKNIGLFCKRALQKRPVFCKETCIFKHPTNRSHPIYCVSRELSEFRSISTRYICWVSRTGGSRGSALIVYINNKGNNIYDIYRTYCLWNEFYIVWSRGSALIVYINNIYIWHI